MLYAFQISQSARMNFDEMLNLFIEENYRASGGAKLSLEDRLDMADDLYDALEVTLYDLADDDIPHSNLTYVDDVEEARARFDYTYGRTIQRLMIDELTDKLYHEERGATGCITVFNDGQENGLHYDSTDVEYVLLDGDRGEVCYRYSDNNMNYEWTVGTVEDAVNEAFSWYEETRTAEAEAEAFARQEAEISEQLYLAEMEALQAEMEAHLD